MNEAGAALYAADLQGIQLAIRNQTYMSGQFPHEDVSIRANCAQKVTIPSIEIIITTHCYSLTWPFHATSLPYISPALQR